MNAISQTIKASQDTAAAAKAAAAAKIEMQTQIYADARTRVAGLIQDFNTMHMELQRVPNGPPGSHTYPLHSSYGDGREYALMGKGLRFFLLWDPTGRNLCLALNAVCRYASEYWEVRGCKTREERQAYESSEALLTLKEAEACIATHTSRIITTETRNYGIMGHITLDGRFATGGVTYDDKEDPKYISATPVDWLTKIVGGYSISPYVVLQEKS